MRRAPLLLCDANDVPTYQLNPLCDKVDSHQGQARTVGIQLESKLCFIINRTFNS